MQPYEVRLHDKQLLTYTTGTNFGNFQKKLILKSLEILKGCTIFQCIQGLISADQIKIINIAEVAGNRRSRKSVIWARI